MRKFIPLAAATLFALYSSTVWSVTFSELPKLDGDVFALQLGSGGEVALFVFEGGDKYAEYRFDSVLGTLTKSLSGEITHYEGPPTYLWQVAGEGGATCATYTYDSSNANLNVNGISTELVKVDYSDAQASIPVAQSLASCVYACALQGCCACCYCVHRSIGVPECLDRLCCRWAGMTC